MKRTRIIQVFLVCMIGALVVAGLVTSSLIRHRQQALDKLLVYNLPFDSNQAGIELIRLQNALVAFKHERTRANHDHVRLRLDILFNRLEVFGSGEPRRFVTAAESRVDLFRAFKDAIVALDSLIADAGLAIDVDEAMALLTPLERPLLGFVSETNRYVAAEAAADRGELARLQWRFASLAIGLIVCGLLLVALLTWNNRLLTRAHVRLSLTTADLKQAAGKLASANRAVAAANDELRDQNSLLLEKKAALRAQNGLFDAALNNMSQGLCMFDSAMHPIVFNTQFESLFSSKSPNDGHPRRGEFPQHSLWEVAPDLAKEIDENIRHRRQASFETEFRDGRVIAVSLQAMSAGDWVATFDDVTEQRQAEARISHMARHDGLTNLPNRYTFREAIESASELARASGTRFAVLCLDLDNFKEVNDTLGHPTGDALLCAAAGRLAASLRRTDVVARIGGDEFAVLQSFIEDREEAERFAARIVEAMNQPFLINGEAIYATTSIGIAIAPTDGDNPDVLLKNADLALYTAKNDGRRTYRCFERGMGEGLSERRLMERDLRQAIERKEFALHYQPIVELRTKRIIGFEALLRWMHPVRGSISPGKFIPIAEEAGLIGEIGRRVLKQACADASHWPAELTVAVNLSAAQFVNGDIVADVASALRHADLPPGRLVVEITESLLLAEKEGAADALRRFKALGVGLAMDDFGTGYSSLSYLRQYPFDKLKIDRTFVSAASRSEQSAAIIRSIVELGASLGMTTVAEGIETEQDLAMLLATGCLEGQGYLYSPAVPRHMVPELLTANARTESKVA